MNTNELHNLTEAIKRGNRADAKATTQRQLDAGAAPMALLDALVAGMDDVGRRFRSNEIFVPEVLIAARAMKEAMALLEPALVASGYQPVATIVIGTVFGDLHDIGKNLVAMMWRGAGFSVHDLGINIPSQRFIDAAKQHKPRIIGLSALLTTTIPSMQETVRAIKQQTELGDVKVMVGGAPLTAELAHQMGADGYAPDAVSAVGRARELIGIS
jgi:5-methyltetrahydrofolate--homocysteine methyltransferase